MSSPNEDFACFAIWERGRSKEAEILSDLASYFEILGTFHVHWTETHYNRNIARLYESEGGTEEFYKYSKKIGKPPFTFIIVRDKKPSYSYMKSVSGAIESANKNVVERKHAYRALFEERFQVHSSGNANEFTFQSALVLGMETLEATLRGDNNGRTIEIRKDLEGADGWRDCNELFSILNYCSNYLILRNFESLPDLLSDEGIDFLCDDYQRLASVANVYQEPATPYKGKIRVARQVTAANIRFVGDGYYPASWEKDILAHRTLNKNFYVPRKEDMFFSLLYHAKVHKGGVSEKYVNLLTSMAKELQYDWFSSEKIHSDNAMGEDISGYMRAKKYFYEKPLDRGVEENLPVIKYLPKLKGARWVAVKKDLRKLRNTVRKMFKKRRVV